MAKPIIVVKENGLEIEVDFQDEPVRRFEIIPPTDPSQTYVLRWDVELDRGKTWKVKHREDGKTKKKHAEIRWS